MKSKQMPLYDLANWKNGLAFKNIHFSGIGLPVIKIAELKNGITAQTQYTNQAFEKDVFLQGDMLFSWSGNPETSIDVFWYDLPDGWLNQHIFKVTPKDGIDKYFLFYLLKSLKPKFTAIASNKQTTGLGHVTVKDLKELIIDVPDVETQRAIGNYLYSIDRKVELNAKVNDNLQQQAATLFKALFVDHAPFDGTMPPNLTISTLGDVTEMGAGGDKPKESSPVKTPLCPYPIYSNGINDYGLYGYTNEPKIKVESVTVSARGTIGYVCLRHIPYVPIVRLVTLIPDTKVLSAKYLYLYLRQLHITGTGTTQQQLTVPDFRKTEIVIPDKNTMDAFTETVTPLFEQIWANEDENTKLAEVRDALLPKLMSGEIDVSAVQL